MTDTDKLLKSFTKKFGEESIILGDKIAYNGDIIPTGSLILDMALGIGGIPEGRIIEIFGGESSGKSTMATTIMAQAQKIGKLCAFVDAENTYDRVWSEVLGVDNAKLLFIQPNSLEDGLEKSIFLIENGVKLVVFDSVAAAPTVSEREGDVGDAIIGVKARIMSQTLSKLIPILRDNKATIIFINQIREKVGVMYGSPETTPGGKSLPFYATIRMRLNKKTIKQKEEVIGDTITVKIIKNKVAPPFRQAELTLIYGKGFDKKHEMYEVGLKLGFVERGGAWITPKFLGENTEIKIQGADKFIEWLDENPDKLEQLEKLIRDQFASGQEKLEVLGITEKPDD